MRRDAGVVHSVEKQSRFFLVFRLCFDLQTRTGSLENHVFRAPFSRACFETRKGRFPEGPKPQKHKFDLGKTMICEYRPWSDGGRFPNRFGYQKLSRIKEKRFRKTIVFRYRFWTTFRSIFGFILAPNNYWVFKKWRSEGVL